jgi:hypothetical protein
LFAYSETLQQRKTDCSRQIFQAQVILTNSEPQSPETQYATEKIRELRGLEQQIDRKLTCLALAM